MKRYIIIISIFFIFGVLLVYRQYSSKTIELDLPQAKQYQEFIETNINEAEPEIDLPMEDLDIIEGKEPILEKEPDISEERVAFSLNLDVPFTSQAPSANWEQPFQDACEEASILMVDYYYANRVMPAKEEVEEILRKMVLWQQDNWGGHYNLTVAQVADFAENYLGYKTEIIDNLYPDKLKQYLNKGLPIIVPADGHKLDNPFFSGDGPDYHMLVIKGYVGDNFISNDPGTKRGKDFVYSSRNLMDSIFDWDQKTDQAIGPKRALILYKN